MGGAALLVLAPVAALGVTVAAHVLVSRLLPRMARPRALVLSACAGLAVIGVCGVWWAGEPAAAAPLDPWGTLAAWGLTYLALVYFYVFGFYNLGESARRIRLLIELEAAGPAGLTLNDILQAYNARMIVVARLSRMAAGGQVVERDGRYVLRSAHVLRGAKTLGLLKRLFFRTEELDRVPVARV